MSRLPFTTSRPLFFCVFFSHVWHPDFDYMPPFSFIFLHIQSDFSYLLNFLDHTKTILKSHSLQELLTLVLGVQVVEERCLRSLHAAIKEKRNEKKAIFRL